MVVEVDTRVLYTTSQNVNGVLSSLRCDAESSLGVPFTLSDLP
jgi:hypothetical protein